MSTHTEIGRRNWPKGKGQNMTGDEAIEKLERIATVQIHGTRTALELAAVIDWLRKQHKQAAPESDRIAKDSFEVPRGGFGGSRHRPGVYRGADRPADSPKHDECMIEECAADRLPDEAFVCTLCYAAAKQRAEAAEREIAALSAHLRSRHGCDFAGRHNEPEPL